LQQPFLAAEQMRAAGDVEKQAMRRVERHQRGEPVAPVGDGVQRLGICCGVGIEHLDIGTDRARIGQRQPGVEAEARGIIIDGRDLQRVVLLGDDNAGRRVSRRGVARTLAPDAVGRQARQPQAQDAPALHGKGTHHISIP
jgi:hypothetical protein